MGRFKEVSNLLELSVPEFTGMKVVPRGTPYFTDILLRGEARFSRRLGNTSAVLNPDNEVELTEIGYVEGTTLTINRQLLWWERGALVSFNGIEMLEVQDWDISGNTLLLNQGLTAQREIGSKLALWATPLKVHADVSSGMSQVVVQSKHSLVNGDVICFPTNANISSLTEIPVVMVQAAGDSGNPDYPKLYNLILSQPLPIGLDTSARMYVRAYPAYISGDIVVPKIKFGQMGPFLLDYLASPLNSINKYEEKFSIQALGGGDIILGTLNSYLDIYKNYPIVNRPIWSDSFIFWKVLKGTGGFIKPSKFKLKTDSVGEAKLIRSLVPEFPANGGKWEFKVKSNSDGILRIKFSPSDFQDFTLIANLTQTFEIELPPEKSTQIVIAVKTEVPSTAVELFNWSYKGQVVDTLRYTYIFKVIGSTNFQATGLILKPYFLSLSDLSLNYDAGGIYNGGSIYL